MDKQSFGSYGTLVAVVLIVAMMISFATPFGDHIKTEVKNLVLGFDAAGNGAVDDMENDTDWVPNSPKDLEGSGQEFDASAPEALTFRSEVPFSEFVGVQINGETLDPQHYTAREGSTIVTISADYLSTLSSDAYVIGIISKSTTVTGYFLVKAPEEPDLEAGLYDIEGNLTATWAQLIEDGAITVENGAIVASDENLEGKLVITDDGSVTSVAADAFLCSCLNSIIVPGSVKTIEEYAFNECCSLESLIMKNGVTSVAYLGSCICALQHVYIPESCIDIDFSLFTLGQCQPIHFEINENNPRYKLTNNLLISLNDQTVMMFAAPEMTSVVIPNGIKNINQAAFADCASLKSVVIPASVQSIGLSAFANCSSLASVTIAEGSQLKTIGESAFQYCTSLENFIIPNGVTDICRSAFVNCTNLTNIAIPASVEAIGNYAFIACTSLSTVTFAENSQLTTIGEAAFKECTSLTNITFKEGSHLATIGDDAFQNCTSLVSINIDPSNQHYQSINGNLYSKDGKTLIQYAIGKSATTFEIPESVTSIEYKAFAGCTSLKTIEIPANITYLGICAFAGCSGLTSVVFADDSQMAVISQSAFSNCSSLTTINIPANIASIHWYSFDGCTSLTDIRFGGTKAQWTSIAKPTYWHRNVPASYVQCSDGQASIE